MTYVCLPTHVDDSSQSYIRMHVHTQCESYEVFSSLENQAINIDLIGLLNVER